MPTVFRIGGARVTIYPNDHRPAHVHVIDAGAQAVFWLNCPDGPPRLRGAYGYSTAALNRIEAGLMTVLAVLCEAWERIHVYY